MRKLELIQNCMQLNKLMVRLPGLSVCSSMKKWPTYFSIFTILKIVVWKRTTFGRNPTSL